MFNGLFSNKQLLYYGMSLTGDSHIKRGIVCQDSHKALTLNNGWLVAAVADGVGSSKHSDIASKMAVDMVVEVCNNRINKSTHISDIKTIIFIAYQEAIKVIEEYADKQNDPLYDYDTTLTMIIYDGEHVVYGHSGDGGIVGLTNEGKYVKITTPQKAEDNICVIPLRAGEKSWVIDEAEGSFASILLATDGMYDTFFPYLLKGQPLEIYVPLIRYFMDNNILMATEKNIYDIKVERENYITSEAYSSVSDDKTVLVVINPKIMPTFQDDSYYAEPDWNKLQLEWNKKAYPHLYKQLNNSTNCENTETAVNSDIHGYDTNDVDK